MLVFAEGLHQATYTDRQWMAMALLSILCHALFFSGIIFLPQFQLERSYIPTTVEVDLVSLPGGGPSSAQGPAPVPAKDEAPPATAEATRPEKPQEEPEPIRSEKEPPPKEAVSLAPKPLEVKRSLKKKSYDVSKAITKAIAKIEKGAAESRPRTVLQAIDQLKKEVQGATGPGAGTGAAGGTGIGKKALEVLDIYNAEIWHQIQKNWAFSEEMAQGRTDLEAVIIVKIMRNGEMRDIWFEKRSGNTYFDETAYRAVKKSDPLPHLPEGFIGPFYEVGFRFNLSELQKNS
jgi:colicin import membrane protein